MQQAIAIDPDFSIGKVIAIRRDNEPLPTELKGGDAAESNQLYIDLRDDSEASSWRLLLKSCNHVSIGMDAPKWLRALDQTHRHLERGESVNLVVRKCEIDWRLWIEQLTTTRFRTLATVDLEHPRAVPRNGLIEEILKATGRSHTRVPPPPNDLPLLADGFENGSRCHLTLTHFDSVKRRSQYGLDFFSSLRWLVMEAQKLVLLAHSDVPIADLLPARHELSSIDFKTVELG
jgi:hypothetical protein